MAQGVTMCNLFELADLEECQNRKPDLIYVYGNKDKEDLDVPEELVNINEELDSLEDINDFTL